VNSNRYRSFSCPNPTFAAPYGISHFQHWDSIESQLFWNLQKSRRSSSRPSHRSKRASNRWSKGVQILPGKSSVGDSSCFRRSISYSSLGRGSPRTYSRCVPDRTPSTISGISRGSCPTPPSMWRVMRLEFSPYQTVCRRQRHTSQ
jgi:hypothetical protein